jgi:hypothetical protein
MTLSRECGDKWRDYVFIPKDEQKSGLPRAAPIQGKVLYELLGIVGTLLLK